MVDLTLPPAPPGTRVRWWLVLTISWAIAYAVAVGTFALGLEPGIADPVWLLVLAAFVTASFVRILIGMRLGYAGSNPLLPPLPRGYFGEDVEERRGPDPEERVAWKRLRRGAIGRDQYERVRARRRFAHGELSSAEYHEILRELDADQSEPR